MVQFLQKFTILEIFKGLEQQLDIVGTIQNFAQCVFINIPTYVELEIGRDMLILFFLITPYKDHPTVY